VPRNRRGYPHRSEIRVVDLRHDQPLTISWSGRRPSTLRCDSCREEWMYRQEVSA
jgi:hypothetical protein